VRSWRWPRSSTMRRNSPRSRSATCRVRPRSIRAPMTALFLKKMFAEMEMTEQQEQTPATRSTSPS